MPMRYGVADQIACTTTSHTEETLVGDRTDAVGWHFGRTTCGLWPQPTQRGVGRLYTHASVHGARALHRIFANKERHQVVDPPPTSQGTVAGKHLPVGFCNAPDSPACCPGSWRVPQRSAVSQYCDWLHYFEETRENNSLPFSATRYMPVRCYGINVIKYINI
jgi:hypothetical protein